jgi:hypothetical protein
VPARAGELRVLDIDFAASPPELLGHLADGWEIVNHTISGIEGDLLLSLFLRRIVVVPDDTAGL